MRGRAEGLLSLWEKIKSGRLFCDCNIFGTSVAWRTDGYGEIVAVDSPECQCVSVYVCVCVWERERERECVCVCVCEKWWGWKGRGCNCWSSKGKTLAITSRPSSIPPLNHHPPFTLVEAAHTIRQHAAWLRASRFQTLSGDTTLSNLDWKPETETGKPRRHWLFTEAIRTLDSGGVSNEKRIFFFGAIF